jgi:hypothetical protein
MRVLLESLRNSMPGGVLSLSLSVVPLAGCSGDNTYYQGAPPQALRGATDIEAIATYVNCPTISSYTVSPFKQAAGVDVTLVAVATVDRGVTPQYLWTATSGTYYDANASSTTYRCGAEKRPSLTLTLFYCSCVDSVEFELDCT